MPAGDDDPAREPKRYVAFHLDLAGGGKNRAIPDTVRYEPEGSMPSSAFLWKVIRDAENNVFVWGHHQRKVGLLGVATWDGVLANVRQKHASIPSDFQWSLVEAALSVELEKAASRPAPSGPGFRALAPDTAGFRDRKRDWTPYEGGTYVPSRERLTDEATPRPPRKVVFALQLIGMIAALIVLYLVFGRSTSKSSESAPAVPARVAPMTQPTPPPAPEPPPPEPPAVRIAKAARFEEAIAIAKPTMTEAGDGAQLFTTYASAKLRWADVDVTAETTIGHVEKDAELERGKRMCAAGEIIRIERRDVGARKVYVGELRTADGETIAFTAVGTTGELIKRSKARFCGAVTGKVALVGMFDLPENRAPIVEQ